MNALEEYNKKCLLTKEDVINAMPKFIKEVCTRSYKDIGISKMKLKSILDDIKDKFLAQISNKEIPILSNFFTYNIVLDELGLSLNIIKLIDENYNATDGYFVKNIDNAIYRAIDEIRVLQVRCKMLSVKELANRENVKEVAIFQKIRRGCIPSAEKYGNSWFIPELAINNLGSKINVYFWEQSDYIFNGEYKFLNKYNRIEISKLKLKSRKFNIKCELLENQFNVIKSQNIEISNSEKEKLELMMLSNPCIKYVKNSIMECYIKI